MSNALELLYLSNFRRRIMKHHWPRLQRRVNELPEGHVWWRAHDMDKTVGSLLLHLPGNVWRWIVSGMWRCGCHEQKDRQNSNVPER